MVSFVHELDLVCLKLSYFKLQHTNEYHITKCIKSYFSTYRLHFRPGGVLTYASEDTG